MAQNTTNSTAFIEAEQYSSFILRNLQDGLLPQSFYRNVTDFPSGTTLHIKTLGDVTIQAGGEDKVPNATPIDSGTITLSINRWKSDAWYITDKLREDGSQVEQLMAERAAASTRAIQEVFETDFLSEAEKAQTNADPNNVNGFAHRIASAETNNIIDLKHISNLKLAFDKANVPAAGRILLVDPVVAATLQEKVTLTSNITSFAQMLLTNGFDREHQALFNIYGFDIITNNRLPKGTFSDGTTSVTDGVANIAMCIVDDNCRPIMGAWRRMPRVRTERDEGIERDMFFASCRYGFGPQRVDTLGTIITSATNH